MIAESIMLRCIANCLETSRYYAGKGNRPLADWWDDRAKVFAHRLASPPNGIVRRRAPVIGDLQ
jgi:hypothetical protein